MILILILIYAIVSATTALLGWAFDVDNLDFDYSQCDWWGNGERISYKFFSLCLTPILHILTLLALIVKCLWELIKFITKTFKLSTYKIAIKQFITTLFKK